ncbi:MAG: hypothetical protein M3Z35_15350 [Nitrospirota bacterium]|nr:hypothetical protein [Nitrospirota bacterium]
MRIGIASGGRYVFWSDGLDAVAVDAGGLSLMNGKLISETENLTSRFTLYQSHGKPILGVDVIGSNGDHYCGISTDES